MSISTKDYSTLKKYKKVPEKIFYEKYSTKKKNCLIMLRVEV